MRGKEIEARQQGMDELKSALREALSQLADAGLEGLDIDLDSEQDLHCMIGIDVIRLEELTRLLVKANTQVDEFTQALQGGVTAEKLAKMTEAVKHRDDIAQDVLDLIGIEASSPEDLPTDEGAEVSDVVVEIESDQSGGNEGPALEAANHTQESDVKSSNTQIPVETERDQPVDSSATADEQGGVSDDIVDVDYEVITRLFDVVAKGEISRAYWLLKSHSELGCSIEVAPITLRCISDAGQLNPGESPGADLRRSLAELAETDLTTYESKLLAMSAVMPVALFAQHKPTWLYTIVNQLRSGSGDAALSELFDTVASTCIDQSVWIGERAISSAAVRSGRSDRLRELQAKAKLFKEQLPHFQFNFRPAAEAFKEAFRDRADLGRLVGIVADDRQKERTWVQDYLKGLDSESVLDELMHGKRHRGRPIPAVQGAARTKMLHHIDQVREMADNWLYLSAEKLAEPNLHAQRELANKVLTLIPSALGSLQDQHSANPWRNLALDISAQSLNRMLAVVRVILNQ